VFMCVCVCIYDYSCLVQLEEELTILFGLTLLASHGIFNWCFVQLK